MKVILRITEFGSEPVDNQFGLIHTAVDILKKYVNKCTGVLLTRAKNDAYTALANIHADPRASKGAVICMDPDFEMLCKDPEFSHLANEYTFIWPVSRRHEYGSIPGIITTDAYPTVGRIRPEEVVSGNKDDEEDFEHVVIGRIMSLIKSGKILPIVTIVDDDSRTKRVFHRVMELLPAMVEIRLVTTVANSVAIDAAFRASAGLMQDYDVIDSHDLIIGYKHSGLAAGYHVHGELSNRRLSRVPYLYPFVDLWRYASITPGQEQQFSKDVIDMNIRYYKRIEKIAEPAMSVFAPEFINFLLNAHRLSRPLCDMFTQSALQVATVGDVLDELYRIVISFDGSE